MGDQMYRLARAWKDDEWPWGFESDVFEQLNETAPDCYHYVRSPRRDDGSPAVELYEYMGDSEQ